MSRRRSQRRAEMDAESRRWDEDKQPDFMEAHGNPALSGRWVRRAGEEPGRRRHECSMPLGEQVGDLWRCGCRRLWRWAHACDECDTARGHGYPPRGLCSPGRMWRSATLGQRIRCWRRS